MWTPAGVSRYRTERKLIHLIHPIDYHCPLHPKIMQHMCLLLHKVFEGIAKAETVMLNGAAMEQLDRLISLTNA
mgnify:CR=1 FL=1